MSDMLFQALTWIVPLVIAIVFHELAHGLVAKWMGDSTASDAGRLSLNPFRHVDPVGTVILPLGLALAHLPVFGWARPVPVDASRMRNPRWGMMAVAIAGPGANIIMALIGAVALGLVTRAIPANAQFSPGLSLALVELVNFVQINVFLAMFNLLPIPPFDGSHLVEGVLPLRAAQAYARLRRFGFVLMVGLLVVLPTVAPGANILQHFVAPPFEWVYNRVLDLADVVAQA